MTAKSSLISLGKRMPEPEWLEGLRYEDKFPPDACTGSPSCEAETHIHGCFADFGECDDPEAHRG